MANSFYFHSVSNLTTTVWFQSGKTQKTDFPVKYSYGSKINHHKDNYFFHKKHFIQNIMNKKKIIMKLNIKIQIDGAISIAFNNDSCPGTLFTVRISSFYFIVHLICTIKYEFPDI